MKRDKRINIVTDKVTKSLLEGQAKGKSISLSELLVEGGLFYGSLDQGFIEKFKKLSGEMGIKASILLQNFVINEIALTAQFEDVFGRSSKDLERIFRWKDGKLMTGDELLEELNKEYREIFRERKKKEMDKEFKERKE